MTAPGSETAGRSGMSRAQQGLLIVLGALLIAGCFGSPLIMLIMARSSEPAPELPAPQSILVDDASRLNATSVYQHLQLPNSPTVAATMARNALAEARDEGIAVSVAGGRNSMGGQTLYPDGLLLDMSALDRIEIDLNTEEVIAGPGTRWIELIEFLDQRRRSPAAVPSDAALTVGGTLGANCHGWQANTPPIASSVVDLYVLTADGTARYCNETANDDLYRFVLGGYGLGGAIVRTKLRVRNNEQYTLERHVADIGEIGPTFDREVRGRDDVGLAFARVCPDPQRLLQQAIVYVFRKQPGRLADLPALEEPGLVELERAGLAAAGGPATLAGQWDALMALDNHEGRIFSRNRLLLDGIEFIEKTRGPITSIYQEYFIPVGAIDAFLGDARDILAGSPAQLRRLTARHVMTDDVTLLRYADQEMYSLMLLFDQPLDDASAERAMQVLAGRLIDAALERDGRFGLSFRMHATSEQFRRAYPHADAFFTAKESLDESGLFANELLRRYR